jgi:predicted benzoate:H+ symporter BenE
VDQDPVDAAVLGDLEQQLFADAVRRFRRRWCAAVAAAVAATVAGLAVLGLRVLPVLLVVMVAGGLVVVSRVTGAREPAVVHAPRRRGLSP